MIKVTDNAFARLHRKLRRQPQGVAVRISVTNGHVRFRPDTEQSGDVVFAHKGHSVLLVAAETARRISQRTLDVIKTDAGDRLRFAPTA